MGSRCLGTPTEYQTDIHFQLFVKSMGNMRETFLEINIYRTPFFICKNTIFSTSEENFPHLITKT